MFKKLTTLFAAAVMAVGLMSVAPQQADARGGRVAGGIAAGIVAGTLLGAYAYGAPRYRTYSYVSGPSCYAGPERCAWSGRECHWNRWGERVCHRGSYRCWRPTICD